MEGVAVNTTKMTDYIATRWYRPPEVLLGTKEYTKAIDMWAVGCILGEMVLRKPMFPGKDTKSQLTLIFSVLGTPSKTFVDGLASNKAKSMMREIGTIRGMSFDTAFKTANPLAIDLVRKLLAFHPQDRLTVDEALEHPYLYLFHNPDDEPVADHHFSKYDFDFERTRSASRIDFRRLIYDEILLYHFPDMKSEYEELMRQRLS
jgi:mitogen-activated protein kinase 1/3